MVNLDCSGCVRDDALCRCAVDASAGLALSRFLASMAPLYREESSERCVHIGRERRSWRTIAKTHAVAADRLSADDSELDCGRRGAQGSICSDLVSLWRPSPAVVGVSEMVGECCRVGIELPQVMVSLHLASTGQARMDCTPAQLHLRLAQDSSMAKLDRRRTDSQYLEAAQCTVGGS